MLLDAEQVNSGVFNFCVKVFYENQTMFMPGINGCDYTGQSRFCFIVILNAPLVISYLISGQGRSSTDIYAYFFLFLTKCPCSHSIRLMDIITFSSWDNGIAGSSLLFK